MRIIFAGSGDFGVPTLTALAQAGHDLHVFTQPDRPAGRGRKVVPTPVGQFALDRSVPLQRTANINVEPLPPADVTVVIAFGQKISPAVAAHARFGSINLHASRLPKYRGAAPINWAILSGETITGNSIIRLAPKMDAGAILAQSQLTIDPLETAGELHDRLAIDGVRLILQTLDSLSTGQAIETPQDESAATAAPKLSRDDTKIDWTTDAAQIARKIRGLSPWPGCRVQLLDAAGGELGRVTLVRAKSGIAEGSRWTPGEVMTNGLISSGDGSHGVEILELQPEGKRPMPLADFRRGNPWMPGIRLQSI